MLETDGFSNNDMPQPTQQGIPYIGNFSRLEILAKMPLGRCVKCSLSPIFAISRRINKNV